jgi:hypothetical protein
MVSKQDVVAALGGGMSGVPDAVQNIHLSGQLGPDYEANATGLATTVFIAPYKCELTRFIIRVKTLESAGGTIDVQKMASGTAIASATDMVTRFVPTAAGGLVAATNENLVVATDGSQILDEGDICILVGGATGELTGVAYTAMFKRLV